MTSVGPEPGWYFDPDGGQNERYWNGTVWTEHRRSPQLAGSNPPKAPSAENADSRLGLMPGLRQQDLPVKQEPPVKIEDFPATSDPGQLSAEGYDDPDSSGTHGALRPAGGGARLPLPTSSTSIAQRWSRLTMKRRISVVVVPILILVVVLTVATGLFAPRGPLDWQWAHRSDSYKAGFEAGGSYVDDVEEQGGSAGSDDEILRTCNLFASNGASLRTGVHWSGGAIAHSNFDGEVFRNGCLDGASDARG